MDAVLTFVLPDDMRAPPFIFTGYRNSHVRFDGLEDIDCLVAFQLIDRDTLGRGETDGVRAEVSVPVVLSHVRQEIQVGRQFHLLQSGRRIADGAITAVRGFRDISD
jgi:hypothetical protein